MNKKNKYYQFPHSHSSNTDLLNDLLGSEEFAPQNAADQSGSQATEKSSERSSHEMEDGLPPYNPDQNGPAGGLFAETPVETPQEPEQSKGNSSPLAVINKLSDEELFSLCAPRLCAHCPAKKEADEIRLRSLAEVDNARKRMAREKEEQVRYAAEKVLADIVPSLDNLELALQHVGNNEACKNFAIGVEMTKKLLLDSLQKHGFKQVGAVGDAFDPALHEAVGMEETSDVPPQHVSKLLSHGYKLHERLLRPAKVMVSK